MGACDFMALGIGTSAKEAFSQAYSNAVAYYGFGGYSGSIAEKHSFVEIACKVGVAPVEYAEELMNNDDERIQDKWGPAGCIRIDSNSFIFFGYASC